MATDRDYVPRPTPASRARRRQSSLQEAYKYCCAAWGRGMAMPAIYRSAASMFQLSQAEVAALVRQGNEEGWPME